MYLDTLILRLWRAILFQRLLPKLASQAHFNTMCFSFSAKMAADANQLKELHEFLHAGNGDSYSIQVVLPDLQYFRSYFPKTFCLK